MNKNITWSIVFLACTMLAKAQAPYTVTTSNAAYANLTGATPLTFSPPPDNGFYATGNFTFKLFARNASFVPVTTPKNSNGGFLASAGYLAIYESPNLDNTIALQCMYVDSFRTVPGITTAWSKLEGTTPNRIMKVEWRDVVYGANTASRANFQIWLHEADGSVSYHYGNNTIPNASTIGAYCGIVVFNPTFTGLVDQFSLSGAATAPVTTYGGTTLALSKLNSIPANGTVYTLKRKTTSVAGIESNNNVVLYPNPASGYIVISTNVASQLSIHNASGQLMTTIKSNGKDLKIDISSFTPGTYFVSGENIPPQHFVVK